MIKRIFRLRKIVSANLIRDVPTNRKISTITTTLSDRLLDSVKESVDNFMATDYVQNILMTGEMTEYNIQYAKIHWKRSKDIIGGERLVDKKAYSLSPTEYDNQTMAELCRVLPVVIAQYYDGFEQLLGGIGPEITSLAMDESMIDYNIMFYTEMKHGSFVRLIASQLVSVWFIDEMYEYLKLQSQYAPTPLSNYLLYLDFDNKALLTVLRSLIDPKAGDISAEEETQLIQLVKEVNDVEINRITTTLSDRLLDSVKESVDNFMATDYVQNILMTGEMTEYNIQYAKIHWKRSKDIIGGDNIFGSVAQYWFFIVWTLKCASHCIPGTEDGISIPSNTTPCLIGESEEFPSLCKEQHQLVSVYTDDCNGVFEVDKKAYSISPTEYDNQTMTELCRVLPVVIAQYYEEFEQLLGGIGPEITSKAMDESMIDYNIMIYTEMKHGSFVRLIASQLVSVWFIDEMYEYLKLQSQYAPTPLSNYLLYLDFDNKALLTVLRSLIDPKAGDISTEEETQLIQLVKEVNDVEIKHHIKEGLSQVIRVDHRSDAIEFDYTCGPIPMADGNGKELVFWWQTNLTTGGVFYTDSNGRQTMRRRRDYRPTYNLTVTQRHKGRGGRLAIAYTALYNPLPRNIHLLTLERWANRTLLLRLEHFYQWNESREWSTPVRVELRDVFREFVVYDVKETTLSAAENILAVRRLRFSETNTNKRFEPKRHELNTTDLSVIINPMEIRTFIIKTKPR
ncbi:unnamed protein product [Medioppia subpectinata]|uniref:Uncharacterized protein n=1 Tax=Medioppia subpectinata TaxID=1979941 RepID=A0A7R9PTT1_9ACAR|nr:unnamed protein product [Medioppia subpectinata]CAG2100056.1 unnamed protein product [Medioppia subpectinata]